jgi:uncharacterized protein YcaQ
MTLHISCEQACRLLALYHFTPTDLPGIFERLGTVQYDPLNPVGRNPDLVFQARVPGYKVDDWQKAAYTDRLIYDAWDKQACLVPVSDWPKRAVIREHYRPYHDRQVLQDEAEAVATVLATIDARGPLSSLEFEDQSPMGDPGSWAGLTRTKRILRSLWVCGQLVTHHRSGGRHYYDRPERVIPEEHFNVPHVLDMDEYHRWIMLRRYQATGMLRTTAEAAIWSACGDSKQRAQAIAQLAEAGELTVVRVGEKVWPYYILTSALKLLDKPLPAPRMLFLGPLDSLLWDRKSLSQLFNFDYMWEVYKPESVRKWGYYVLPVFYGDRFVARVDSRLERGVWIISRWWWEPGITPDAELLDALRAAVERFLCYLRAESVQLAEGVDKGVRQAVHELGR